MVEASLVSAQHVYIDKEELGYNNYIQIRTRDLSIVYSKFHSLSILLFLPIFVHKNCVTFQSQQSFISTWFFSSFKSILIHSF